MVRSYYLPTFLDPRLTYRLAAGFEVCHCLAFEGSVQLLIPSQLFTDFVFADFLVTYTPYVSKVAFQYAYPPPYHNAPLTTRPAPN